MIIKNYLVQKLVIDSFTKLYYHYKPRIWNKTFWFGIPIGKCPSDLWIYQEIIYELKPDIIIECGTGAGGSALFFANHLDLVGHGKIITIDIKNNSDRPIHNRITYITGSSIAEETIKQIGEMIKNKDKVLVILDSDHSKDHVLKELNCYSKLVSLDCYIIVEDTIIGGHPVKRDRWPGPMEAIKEFLKTNNNFIIDKSREKFLLTFNRNGYLKKIK